MYQIIMGEKELSYGNIVISWKINNLKKIIAYDICVQVNEAPKNHLIKRKTTYTKETSTILMTFAILRTCVY